MHSNDLYVPVTSACSSSTSSLDSSLRSDVESNDVDRRQKVRTLTLFPRRAINDNTCKAASLLAGASLLIVALTTGLLRNFRLPQTSSSVLSDRQDKEQLELSEHPIRLPPGTRFDCNQGFNNWHADWSDIKKSWCCHCVDRGCTPEVRPIVVAHDACQSAKQEASQSDKVLIIGSKPERRDPPTAKEGLGVSAHESAKSSSCTAANKDPFSSGVFISCCEGSTRHLVRARSGRYHYSCYLSGYLEEAAPSAHHTYDCTAGFSSWRKHWDDKKRKYCCRKVSRGCPEIDDTQFDCDVGLANWHSGWSDAKKAYCCRTASRGCAPRASANSSQKSSTKPSEKPTECHTAVDGERCHFAILWARFQGLHEHPEWYDGLSEDSSVEEFQANVHATTRFFPFAAKRVNGCPKPCHGHTPFPTTTTPTPTTTSMARPGQSPKLFCFMVVRPGYELDIAKTQKQKRAGVYACDGHAVLCDSEQDVDGQKTLVIPQAGVGVSKDGTAANTQLFMGAWSKIHEDGRFQNFDWTVKVDPDAVLLPERLRVHLASQNGANVYVKNCDKLQGPGWPMMFGALEAFSKTAITAYFTNSDRCRNELQWQPWGEDVFMASCLDHIGVTNSFDGSILQDGVCKGVWCGDKNAAAFHPMKSVDSWLKCWNEASR